MVSDSSGVCTSNSGSAESYDATPTDVTQFDMGMLVVCLQQYTAHKAGHLDISAGDILEGEDTGLASPHYLVTFRYSVLYTLKYDHTFWCNFAWNSHTCHLIGRLIAKHTIF